MQGCNLQDAIVEQVTDLMKLCHDRGYSFMELADAAHFQHRDEQNHLLVGELEHAETQTQMV
jgi:hypothetical protein